MNIYKKITAMALASAMMMSFAACSVNESGEDDGVFNIVTSFYPMEILTMNIAGGIDGVTVECMSDPNMGCIHDHTFSTEDLRMLENADIFIENGLDLETFNDRALAAYPDLFIVEAAQNVTDAPEDDGEINGHVWTSIDDYIIMIDQVRESLCEADPDHAAEYTSNAERYVSEVTALQEEYADVIGALEGRSVLVLDETLPSFCIYTGMDYHTIETDHEQSALSAGGLREAIEYVEENGVSGIFIGADGDEGIANAISEETGVPVFCLNTCMTGEVDAEAYITQMVENLTTLRAMVV